MFKAIKSFIEWMDQRRREREEEERQREEDKHFEWLCRNTDPSVMLKETAGMIGDAISTIDINKGFNALAVQKYGLDLKSKYQHALIILTSLVEIVSDADAILEETINAYNQGEKAPEPEKAAELQQAG